MHDDAILLGRWSDGRDAQAFTELVERHGGLVYGTCRRILGDHQAAEDVAQECLLELARRASSVRSSVAGFLHTVATSRARNRLRQDRARQRRELAAGAAAGEGSGEPTWAELAPIVDDAVAALPDDERVPILLHFFEGRSQAQIAAELGCGQASVSRRIDRGVATLRDRLRRAGAATSVIALTAALAGNASAAAPPAIVAAAGRIALTGLGSAAAPGGVALAIAAKVAAVAVIATALAVGGIVAQRALASRRPAAPTTLLLDFEDGRANRETVGAIVPGPPRDGSRACLAGADLGDVRVTRAMVVDRAPALFAYRDDAELSFVYYADDRVAAISVYLWDATQGASMGALVLTGPTLTHGRWTRASARVADFAAGTAHPRAGDLVTEIVFQTGSGFGGLFIDDVRVAAVRAR